MKRRNFLKTSAAGSVFFGTNSLFVFQKDDDPDIMAKNSIDPLIPLRIFQNHEEEILSQMIEMRTKYGFRRFMLLAPNKTVRFSGFPVPLVTSITTIIVFPHCVIHAAAVPKSRGSGPLSALLSHEST